MRIQIPGVFDESAFQNLILLAGFDWGRPSGRWMGNLGMLGRLFFLNDESWSVGRVGTWRLSLEKVSVGDSPQ